MMKVCFLVMITGLVHCESSPSSGHSSRKISPETLSIEAPEDPHPETPDLAPAGQTKPQDPTDPSKPAPSSSKAKAPQPDDSATQKPIAPVSNSEPPISPEPRPFDPKSAEREPYEGPPADSRASWTTLEDGLMYRKQTQGGSKIHAFKIKQGQFEVFVHPFEAHQAQILEHVRQQLGARIVVNGGFNQIRHQSTPDGLLVVDGVERSSINDNLSGVLWVGGAPAGHGGDPDWLYLDSTHSTSAKFDWTSKSEHVSFAIQGKPKIVEVWKTGGILSTARATSYRSAVCVMKDYFVIMVTDRNHDPMNLYDLSTVMMNLDCRMGLNLDGGPATSISVQPYEKHLDQGLRIDSDDPQWVFPNAIVVR
ncbi:MAG: phosphodiester glycosidase family protein [Bdellovibrionota bacterium]